MRDFPFAPLKYVKSLLAGNDQLLLPTYLELEDIVRGWDKLAEKPWVKNFDATRLRAVTQRQEAELERALERSDLPQPYREELEEMQAARLVRSFRDKMRKEKEDKVSQPQQQPQAGGDDCEPAAEVVECQCCFDEQPMAGMIHCNGEEAHVSVRVFNSLRPSANARSFSVLLAPGGTLKMKWACHDMSSHAWLWNPAARASRIHSAKNSSTRISPQPWIASKLTT